MGHTLTIGQTESGKTLLNKSFCRDFDRKGIASIILDPLNDPDWQTPHRFKSAPEFLELAKASRSCALFIDESGSSVGKYNPDMDWCTTQARHWGHKTYLICQRAQQVGVTLRNQCSQMFVFNVGMKDAKLIAEEWSRPEIEGAADLPQFHFFWLRRFQPVQRMKIEPGSLAVTRA
jgi:hypothetical protein